MSVNRPWRVDLLLAYADVPTSGIAKAASAVDVTSRSDRARQRLGSAASSPLTTATS